LSRGASREDVRRAHRKLVREYHPDVNPGDDSAEERFKEVQHAYEVLSDPRKQWEYDEELLRASFRGRVDPGRAHGATRARARRGAGTSGGGGRSPSGEDLSDLLCKLVDLFDNRYVNSWRVCVHVLALFLIINGFLFYRYEQLENSVAEPPTTASTSLQSIPSSAEDGEGRRAERQAEENDTDPDAIDYEQQDSSSYLRGTEPVVTEYLSPYPLSSTTLGNYPTPAIAEEALTILPTSGTAADYYTPNPLYEDSYYLPDPFYEDSYYLPDPLYEDSYYLPGPFFEDSYYLPNPFYLPDPFYGEEVDYE
jgi:curved DNA-binding protein CbpA